MSVNFKSPCYGCTERSAECHSTCDRYKAYTDKCAEVRAERQVWNKVREVRYAAFEYAYSKHHDKRRKSHWEISSK